MKKVFSVFVFFLFIVVFLTSCDVGNIYIDTHTCILKQDFDDETLQVFQLSNLPKINSVDNAYYEIEKEVGLFFNLPEDEFESWVKDLISYLDSREDIMYWGKAVSSSIHPVESSDVLSFDLDDIYEEKIAIAFTTQDIVDNKFQNCYRIEIVTPKNQWSKTIDGASYKFDHVIKLYDCCEYASNYIKK